jgi:phosphate acyltransferase
MKIAIDVMGGDFAPRELVLGARQFLESGSAAGSGDDQLILVGDEGQIRTILPDLPARCEIVHTTEWIEMGETPTQALRKKKQASVALAARLVKEKRADAFLSAGSTGAQMAASLLEIGRLPGIERPAVSVLLPTSAGHGAMVLDVGANVDCRPVQLYQFALMGAAYYQRVCNVERPRVGLLNNGSEAGKGNDLTKAAFELLSKSRLNFIGNIEPDHLFAGDAHVIVCDGFVGNILLKASEGLAELILGGIKQSVAAVGLPPEQAQKMLFAMRRFQTDAPEYSAAPLLGIAGGAVVCHGKSKAPVIANAIRLASTYSSTDVLGLIGTHLDEAGSMGRSADPH